MGRAIVASGVWGEFVVGGETIVGDIVKFGRRKPLWDEFGIEHEAIIGADSVERLLPHRFPMLFVDRISRVDLPGQVILAHRAIDPRDPVFVGHFPGHAVYPGALLVETAGQACLCLQRLCELGRPWVETGDSPAQVRLLKVHHALFLDEVGPGDAIDIIGRRLYHDEMTVLAAGQILKQGRICALAVLEVYLVP